jgi:hypothetical protein
MRRLSAMLAAAALLLVGAAPASAVTGGFGIAKSLRGLPLPVSFPKAAKGKGKDAACAASSSRSSKTQQSKAVSELAKQFLPVACEQPPRSEAVASEALKHATAAALAVLG